MKYVSFKAYIAAIYQYFYCR